MERWLIHWPRVHEARPWPFGLGWRSVIEEMVPLHDAVDQFGLVSMCDGSSERPHVPANLPRLEPAGAYRAGFYHDRQALYVVVQGREAPPVVSREAAERRAGPIAEPPVTVELNLMAADSARTWQCARQFNGEQRQRVHWSAHGPRVPAEAGLVPSVEFCEAHLDELYRCGRRIPRSSLRAFMQGNHLRVSLLWQSYTSLELAVWGSSAGWGIRTDEMVTLRLVEEPTPPLGPVCEQVVLAYDPETEQGRFELAFSGLYRPGEAVSSPTHRRVIHSDKVVVKLNGVSRLYDLQPRVTTEVFALQDGYNCLQVSTAGGEPVVAFIEKRSGNRIGPCLHPAGEPPAQDAVLEQMRRELAKLHEEMQARQAGDEELDLLRWPLYAGASCGRYYRYLEEDPRCLEILRDVADRALALQRDDGTFSGYHLGRHYAQSEAPRWSGGAYDSGQAGELWCIAAWVLEDERYLRASQRLVAAYQGYRIEFNQNFAAFALYHLVTHYRLTGEAEALEQALYYCRHLVATKILPLGYQSGHNYYTVYGFITLRGMTMLCQVLPETHPYRPELRELCLRMGNQLLSRLQADGMFDSRDRVFVGETFWISGLFCLAPLVTGEDAERLDAALQLQLGATPDAQRRGFLDSEVIRYLAYRADADRLAAREAL